MTTLREKYFAKNITASGLRSCLRTEHNWTCEDYIILKDVSGKYSYEVTQQNEVLWDAKNVSISIKRTPWFAQPRLITDYSRVLTDDDLVKMRNDLILYPKLDHNIKNENKSSSSSSSSSSYSGSEEQVEKTTRLDSKATASTEAASLEAEELYNNSPDPFFLPMEPSMVFLNLYHVRLTKYEISMGVLNDVVSGMQTIFGGSTTDPVGAYHTAIEVYGDEWQFGYCRDPGVCGISKGRPRLNRDHEYKESIPLGETKFTRRQIRGIVQEELTSLWQANSYCLKSKNCCDFAEKFCERLGIRTFPKSVNLLGQWLPNIGAVSQLSFVENPDVVVQEQRTPRVM